MESEQRASLNMIQSVYQERGPVRQEARSFHTTAVADLKRLRCSQGEKLDNERISSVKLEKTVSTFTILMIENSNGH